MITPVDTSQIFTVLSPDERSSKLPSGENETSNILSLLYFIIERDSPVSTSNFWAIEDEELMTMHVLVGSNVAAWM